MIAGDNDTCDKFFASINDNGEQLLLATTFFSNVVDTGQKYPKSLKLIAGVNDTTEKLFIGVNNTAEKTVLTIPACLDLKMKNKQKFNLQ
jgi:hypothetical protein